MCVTRNGILIIGALFCVGVSENQNQGILHFLSFQWLSYNWLIRGGETRAGGPVLPTSWPGTKIVRDALYDNHWDGADGCGLRADVVFFTN